jgi:hypothetical protein
VFANKLLGNMFELPKDEVSDFFRLHNKELRLVKSRGLRWADHVPRVKETSNAHRISLGKPHGKRLVG